MVKLTVYKIKSETFVSYTSVILQQLVPREGCLNTSLASISIPTKSVFTNNRWVDVYSFHISFIKYL